MGATGSAQGHPSLPTARGCLGLHGGLSQPPQTPGLNTSAGLPLTPWPYAVIQFCCCCCQGASVVSDSVGPHRRQPTRLPRPWDSPGKNTGVGCHFLLQCMNVKSESEVAQSCPTRSDPMDCSPPGSSVPGIFQARVLEWGAIAFSGDPALDPSDCLRCLPSRC